MRRLLSYLVVFLVVARIAAAQDDARRAPAEPTARPAEGGPWNRIAGGYYVKFGLTWLSADAQFDPDGRRRTLYGDDPNFQNSDIGATDLDIHAEYGLTDWLTGVVSTQHQTVVREAWFVPQQRDTTASASGLSDLWIDARVRLLPRQWPTAVSASVGVKVPTASSTQAIPLGTGAVDYQLLAAVGRTFELADITSGFARLTTGFRLRNRASNEFLWSLETGVRVIEPLQLRIRFNGTVSTADFAGQPALADGVTVDRALVLDQSFSRWSLGLRYDVNPGLELQAGYGRTFAGNNALASGSFSLGLAWKK